MFGGLASVVGMVQRITRSADALLSRGSRRSWRVAHVAPRGPGLVRGRGFARRRPPRLLSSGMLAWLVALLLGAAILALYFLCGL